MNDHGLNCQSAPYPFELAELVGRLRYKPGFSFVMRDPGFERGQGSTGLTLSIIVRTPNSYDREQIIAVEHLMPVPPASYGRETWRRWLLEQCFLVDRHEGCEFFEIEGEGKPFAPNHGPGRDPYTIYEYTDDEHRRTSSRGNVKPV